MSDFGTTYVSRGGVRVMKDSNDYYRVLGLPRSGNCGVACSVAEAAALFEPIPEPIMVEISIELARAIRADVNRACRLNVDDSTALEDAIAKAEHEATKEKT